MKNYDFTLILDKVNENTPNLEDSLYEAGCDDALINFRNGTVFLDFSRDAISLEKAVLFAIHQIESSHLGTKVIGVAPESLVSESDIARRLDVKKQAISLWVKKQRRNTIPFPHPIMKLSDTSPLWRWREIVAWSLKNDIINEKNILDEAIFLENLNLVLIERNTPEVKLRNNLLRVLNTSTHKQQNAH